MASGWRDLPWSEDLEAVLSRARDLGFLGPGPIDGHVEQALRLADLIVDPPSRPSLDLGSGGGVPGLILALRWPSTRWVLLDSMVRRTGPLTEAIGALELGDRVEVRTQRAEEAARDPQLRGAFDLVTARSFGPPAVVAECGAPFLAVGGCLAVTSPPSPRPDRWPVSGLQRLGLETARDESGWHTFVAVAPCPADRPRRTGQPRKRPMW